MILRRDDDGVNVEYERWVDESTSATSGDARGEEGEES